MGSADLAASGTSVLEYGGAGDSAYSTIEPEELAQFTFSERDAIFLTDEAQFDYLSSNTNSSFQRCCLLPVSTQAYAAALDKHPRVQSYFDFVDFPECKRQYNLEADRLSRAWLKELNVGFELEGLDLAEFDAPCQFLFFSLAAYLERTAEKLIRSLPDVTTFYVVSAADPLPLDFYFDSDVPAALLRFTCEQLGRRVRQIVLAQRTWIFPYPHRPITSCPNQIDTPELESFRGVGGTRAGFAPSTSANCQEILDGLRAIRAHTVLFRSTWGMPLLFSGQAEVEVQLTDGKLEGSSDWDQQLAGLWATVQSRRDLSSLPRNVIANPHIDFQLAYIITRRWLSYVNMIRRAKDVVDRIPLDLFIHSQTLTAEGTILAHFYRRAGTPILVVPHSRWPSDRNWNTCQPSDAAIVFSKSAAERLRRVTRISKVLVTPPPAPATYRSLLRTDPEPNLVEQKKKLAAGRKVAVLVTNAPELLLTPFTDLGPHFRAISVLAEVPEHLRDRVLVVVRTKPRPLGEDLMLYRTLCGFPDESLTFLKGLTFSQCLKVADCAIGVNLPTTGYFEIMEQGIPLIHIQNAPAVTLHPDLPPRVTAEVRSLEAIWPTIESVLFNQRHRQRLLKIQRQFCKVDQGRRLFGESDSIETTLLRLTGKNGFRIWPRKKKSHSTGLVQNSIPQNIDVRNARFTKRARAGYVDDLLSVSNGFAAVAGWAADFAANRPAKAVHIFANTKPLASGSPNLSRPDVAEVFGQQGVANSGFLIRIPFSDQLLRGSLEAYAELSDGSVVRLTLPEALQKDPGRSTVPHVE